MFDKLCWTPKPLSFLASSSFKLKMSELKKRGKIEQIGGKMNQVQIKEKKFF